MSLRGRIERLESAEPDERGTLVVVFAECQPGDEPAVVESESAAGERVITVRGEAAFELPTDKAFKLFLGCNTVDMV